MHVSKKIALLWCLKCKISINMKQRNERERGNHYLFCSTVLMSSWVLNFLDWSVYVGIWKQGSLINKGIMKSSSIFSISHFLSVIIYPYLAFIRHPIFLFNSFNIPFTVLPCKQITDIITIFTVILCLILFFLDKSYGKSCTME